MKILETRKDKLWRVRTDLVQSIEDLAREYSFWHLYGSDLKFRYSTKISASSPKSKHDVSLLLCSGFVTASMDDPAVSKDDCGA
jgi:hypothetical protein